MSVVNASNQTDISVIGFGLSTGNNQYQLGIKGRQNSTELHCALSKVLSCKWEEKFYNCEMTQAICTMIIVIIAIVNFGQI